MKRYLMSTTSDQVTRTFEDYQRERDLISRGWDTFLRDGYTEEALWLAIRQSLNDAAFKRPGWITHFKVGIGASKYLIWGLSVPETEEIPLGLGYQTRMFFYNTLEQAMAASALRAFAPIQVVKSSTVTLGRLMEAQRLVEEVKIKVHAAAELK